MCNHGGHEGRSEEHDKGRTRRHGFHGVPPCPPWFHLLVGALILTACGGSHERVDNAPPPGKASPTCGVDSRTVLSGSGIGALRIGATVAEVRSQCMVLSEDMAAPGPEGQPEHRLVVVTGSVNTTAAVVDGRVWRLYVASPLFRTADSLGVGTRVGELRGPQARLARGEGTFVLRGDHCGLSFQLGPGVPPDARTLDAVPDSVRVERVLVIRCPAPGQP